MSIVKPTVVLKRFFFSDQTLSKTYIRHLQSFVTVFNEQVQNTEKSKVEVVSCLTTVKVNYLRENQMYSTYQIKLNQR